MSSTVLDASALLALILNEPGAEAVAAAIGDAAMTTVNLAEVVGYLARAGLSEADIRELLDELPMQLMAMDPDLAYGTGLLISVTRSAGLSLGDRACLAFARRLGVKALTADRQWRTIAAAADVEVECIR